MSIRRNPSPGSFLALSNDVINDDRLSFCALGLLGYLLSKPVGQRCDIRTLADQTPESPAEVASAMRELEDCGYVRRTRRRTAKGRVYLETRVYDTPQPIPDAGKRTSS